MTSKQRKGDWLNQELADELAETVSALSRLGVTLAGLPMALLPSEQRRRARQITSELLRYGAAFPRAFGSMLEEAADEWQGEKREDLGSRLRREQRRAAKVERRTGRSETAREERETDAVEEIEEDIQEAWEIGPQLQDDVQQEREE